MGVNAGRWHRCFPVKVIFADVWSESIPGMVFRWKSFSEGWNQYFLTEFHKTHLLCMVFLAVCFLINIGWHSFLLNQPKIHHRRSFFNLFLGTPLFSATWTPGPPRKARVGKTQKHTAAESRTTMPIWAKAWTSVEILTRFWPWLFNRDPYFMVYYISWYNWVVYSLTGLKQPVVFSLHKWLTTKWWKIRGQTWSPISWRSLIGLAFQFGSRVTLHHAKKGHVLQHCQDFLCFFP